MDILDKMHLADKGWMVAHQNGYKAFYDHAEKGTRARCPHGEGTYEAEGWWRGYRKAEATDKLDAIIGF